MNFKKNFVIKIKIFDNILFRYSIFKDWQNMQITVKKLYLKDANGEDLCFLNKNYQLTTEKEAFWVFWEHRHARMVASNNFAILEQNMFTNLKKSKNFLWAIEQHKKTKTGEVSKEHWAVETLERWVSVFNYCLFLHMILKSKSIAEYRNLYLKALLGILLTYDSSNKIEFGDIDIIEKMLENRDSNSLAKFMHDKAGVNIKYESFVDPKGLKAKTRFNYLNDWKNHPEFQESRYPWQSDHNRKFLESMAKFDKLQDNNIIIRYFEVELDGKPYWFQNNVLTFWETESFLLFFSKLALGYITYTVSKHPK